MTPRSFTKQPFEEITKATDFSQVVESGVTVSSGTVTAIKVGDQSDASMDVLSAGTCVVSGLLATWKVKGGVDQEDYKITVKVTFSNGDKLEEDVTMKVREQ
jgi:hypothetical protein